MAGGIFAGDNPISPDHIISLLLVQIMVVIFMTRILSVILLRLKQPRVIAEVLTGIVLGPSVLGNWQAWSDNIFPLESMNVLKAFSEFGLIFFMFTVGLELDTKLMKAHLKESIIISTTGIIFPFLLSIITSLLLYNQFSDDSVSFTSFLLFIGVSMSITAFPVLARILSDQKLLATKVGMTSISAAAVGDAASWVFLALVISIVNSSSSPVNCVYILIVGCAFAIFMMTLVKKAFNRLMQLSSTREDLNPFMLFLTFAMILASSWFTEAIGIHSIFGAFLTGLIIPQESGFAIKLTEKIEDFISVLFVPLYFAYSGLQTKLSALNSLTVWAMLILVIFMACFGKIFFSTIAAKFCKLTWRESFTLGILMNTKGLVELIVLNIGREANVIDDRVFAIMVVMAVVTTLITTPAVSAIYNPTEESSLESIDVSSSKEDIENVTDDTKSKLKSDYNMVILFSNLSFVSPMLNLLQIIQPYFNKREINQMQLHLNVNALRLIQMDERTSTFLMMSNDSTITLSRDPIYNIFQSFKEVCKLAIDWTIAAAKVADYPEHIINAAKKANADLVILPWLPLDLETRQRTLESWLEVWSSSRHKGLIADVYSKTHKSAVAAFIDHGFGHFSENSYDQQHPLLTRKNEKLIHDEVDNRPKIFIPFMGGPDDREALKFVLKLSANANVAIHILRIKKLDLYLPVEDQNQSTINSMRSNRSAFSDNMFYILPNESEINKDNKLINIVHQYIESKGKLTIESLFSKQYNKTELDKYNIKLTEKNKYDRSLSGINELTASQELHEEEKDIGELKAKSAMNENTGGDPENDGDKSEDKTASATSPTTKSKRRLPDLLVRSRDNVDAVSAGNSNMPTPENSGLPLLSDPESEQIKDDKAGEGVEEDGGNYIKSKYRFSEEESNIIIEEVETTDPVKLATKKCTEYTNHDLIIIGRTGAYRHHNSKPLLQQFLNANNMNTSINQQTVTSVSSAVPTVSSSTNNPLANLFYRRSINHSRSSLPTTTALQTEAEIEQENAAKRAALKGFRKRQQVLLGELGGNLMALKNEVRSSIMVFRAAHTIDHELYEDDMKMD